MITEARMKLTKTQQRIHDILRDGMLHPITELHACLYDDLSTNKDSAVRHHISDMRKALGEQGQDISCRTFKGVSHYVLGRYVSSGE